MYILRYACTYVCHPKHETSHKDIAPGKIWDLPDLQLDPNTYVCRYKSNDTFCKEAQRSLGCRFSTARHGSLMDRGIDWCGVQVQAEKVEFVSVDASTIDTNIDE